MGIAVAVGVALGVMSVLADGVLPLRWLTLAGNLVVPWLLPPFFVGLLTTSPRRGALAGGVVALVGVATYYGLWIPRGYAPSLLVAAWTVAALVSGPVMGLCGALTARQRHHPPLLAAVAPATAAVAEAAFFTVERRVWLWDFAVHPHRWTDLSVLLMLWTLGLLLPVWLVRPLARLRLAYPAALAVGLGGAGLLFAAYRVLVALPRG